MPAVCLPLCHLLQTLTHNVIQVSMTGHKFHLSPPAVGTAGPLTWLTPSGPVTRLPLLRWLVAVNSAQVKMSGPLSCVPVDVAFRFLGLSVSCKMRLMMVPTTQGFCEQVSAQRQVLAQGLPGTEFPVCVEAGTAGINTNSKITLSIPSSESRVHPDVQGEP